ncbi:MAG: hypothetical protein JXR12_18650 [Neptunomonas phycophila]|uniref:DUF6384 family protein n=1 Tax=Neptunomonas phycophila TaxID=1572645 RepID=UPI003B8BFC6B
MTTTSNGMENTASATESAATSASESSAPRAKLEDVMAAMDVVDTLRHRQGMVERELDADSRRAQLLERLRTIYADQGMEVPDHILEEGIKALDEDRFKYHPTKKSISTALAHAYVSRKKWGLPLGAVALVASLLFGGNYWLNERPQQLALEALPSNLQQTYTEIQTLAKQPDIAAQAKGLQTSANAALQNDKQDTAEALLADMENMLVQLRMSYHIKVVSRAGEQSGVWRIPDINYTARNYYLIVEAIDGNNNVLTLPVLNEETGKQTSVDKWGLRVDYKTFNQVAADKQDDGIIQGNVVGEKRVGYLSPEYRIATSGATITAW